MNQLVTLPSPALRVPVLVAAAGERARWRFLEFFTANIRNPHTRRAYCRDVTAFLNWCAGVGVRSIGEITTFHVAGYVEALTLSRSAPTAKRQLAAIRHLFDWLVTGQIVATNLAASVRGPKYGQREGVTPVLPPDEARQLLSAIDVGTIAGLRNRALIGLMVYSFTGIATKIGNHTLRGTGIATYLKKRRYAGEGARHRQPCRHAHDAALRSSP